MCVCVLALFVIPTMMSGGAPHWVTLAVVVTDETADMTGQETGSNQWGFSEGTA